MLSSDPDAVYIHITNIKAYEKVNTNGCKCKFIYQKSAYLYLQTQHKNT
jgi:hypothetical protein